MTTVFHCIRKIKVRNCVTLSHDLKKQGENYDNLHLECLKFKSIANDAPND